MKPTDHIGRQLVVIESPYAASAERAKDGNIDYARRCMADAIERGEAPIASHLLYPQYGILDDDQPEERAIGIGCGLAWACQADKAVFYLDRGISSGMETAIEFYHSIEMEMEPRWLEPGNRHRALVAALAGSLE